MKAGTRILVVEDDRSIARLVQLELEHRNFAVLCAYDGPSGLEAVSDFQPAVIVLDIMLPKLDGVGVLKKLRAAGNKVPVIMLTARGDPLDKVHSLDRGADDYLTKPFNMEELMARLRALLRRAGEDEVIRVADLEIDTGAGTVKRGGQEIHLTRREFTLLEALAANEGRVLTREVILDRIWMDEESYSNTVDVHIGLLRKKVDAGHSVRLIHTVHGVGYSPRGPDTEAP